MKDQTAQQLPADPASEIESASISLRRVFLKTILFTLGFLSIFLIITFFVTTWFLWRQWQAFSSASGASFAEIRQTLEAGWYQPLVETNGYKNILLLGVDSLETRGNAPALTDTMIIVSLDLNSGTIKTLPLPRDIWSDEYQTKINALLVYGEERDPENPTAFPTQVLAEMTGVPIHHTVVISLETLGLLIDSVGGIEIDVQQGFTDPQFPNPDVDVTTETDPEVLYQPVTFEAGPQLMDSDQALTFIRSRYSSSPEGTDLARSKRQQQVINALASKIMSIDTMASPQLLGKLYRFYLENFGNQIPLTEIIALGRQLAPYRQNIRFQSVSLSVAENNQPGVIEHPPVNRNQYMSQWVYIIPNLSTFQEEITQLLF